MNAPATDMAVIEEITPEKWSAVYDGREYLNTLVEKIRADVISEVPDLESKKGRSRIASLAAKVSSAKKAVETPGRDYLREIKAKVKPIEENIRAFVTAMDAIRDEVRAPLDRWEAAEAARVNRHKEAIEKMRGFGGPFMQPTTAETLRDFDRMLDDVHSGDFEEFQGIADATFESSKQMLSIAIRTTEKREAEIAELEKLRAEKEWEERRREAARIAEEAAIKARADADAAHKKEQEAAQRREIEARIAQERAEQEKLLAEERARQAEARAAEQAERAARETEERIRREADAAAKREADEKAEREADKAHRAKINSAIRDALISVGLTDDQARSVVIAFVKGEIPHVTVNY